MDPQLIILSQSKRPEEREFYLRMAVQEKWASRDLERQFKAALFERTVLSPAKVSAVLTQMQPQVLGVPAFACSPDRFPELMAAAIQRADLRDFAANAARLASFQ